MLMFKSTYERLLQEERRKREDQRDLVRKTEDENYRLKEKIIKLELDLKIAKMYIDDDEALQEAIKAYKSKKDEPMEALYDDLQKKGLDSNKLYVEMTKAKAAFASRKLERAFENYQSYLAQAQRDALYNHSEYSRRNSALGQLGHGLSNNALFF